jgi:hypothetical protein
MTKEEELIEIAKTKLKHECNFIALRDTESHESYSESYYHKEKGKVGSMFEYEPIEDILYNKGFGKFVVYEKGRWFDEVEPNYEVY